MSVQLIIYRGTHEIGGNCVELRTNSARIILDCGVPLVDENEESFNARSIDGKTIPELIEAKITKPIISAAWLRSASG